MKMQKTTIRMTDYLYDLIKAYAKRNFKSINEAMNDLIQNGFLKELEVEQEYEQQRKTKTNIN